MAVVWAGVAHGRARRPVDLGAAAARPPTVLALAVVLVTFALLAAVLLAQPVPLLPHPLPSPVPGPPP